MYCYYLILNPLGLFTCYRGPCTSRRRSHLSCASRFLLSSTSQYHHRRLSTSNRRCALSFSPLPRNLQDNGCRPSLLLTSSTLAHALCSKHSTLCCTQWSLLVNHREQAHQSGQGALATIEPFQCAWSDITDQSTARQTFSTASRLHASGDAHWHLSLSSQCLR